MFAISAVSEGIGPASSVNIQRQRCSEQSGTLPWRALASAPRYPAWSNRRLSTLGAA